MPVNMLIKAVYSKITPPLPIDRWVISFLEEIEIIGKYRDSLLLVHMVNKMARLSSSREETLATNVLNSSFIFLRLKKTIFFSLTIKLVLIILMAYLLAKCHVQQSDWFVF